MDKPIIFNEKEAQALVELINLAVKSAGLSVSEAAVILVGKIQKAFAPVPKVGTDVPQETGEKVDIASVEELKQPEEAEQSDTEQPDAEEKSAE